MNVPGWLKENGSVKRKQSGLYWFRTPVGLEAIAQEEIEENLPLVQAFSSHRNVFVELQNGAIDFKNHPEQIRTADDVFVFKGCYEGVERAKASVEGLLQYFSKYILPGLSEYSPDFPIRVTVSFVGKRNFNRFFIENKCNKLIQQHTAFRTLSNEIREPGQEHEIRLRCHIEADLAFFGISLKDMPLHRRPWRALKYPGQLRPTVAAAMARILKAEKDTLIIDPFCGSGTILIEAAIQCPSNSFLGLDLNEEAIKIARSAAARATIDINFKKCNSLSDFPARGKYSLVSNPPWDEKHPLQDRQAFVAQLIKLIQNSSRSVLILPEELVDLIQKTATFDLKKRATTRIRGKLAQIIQIA